MKKAISVLMYLLFGLIIFYPLSALLTACFSYYIELVSVSAFAIATAVLSICVVVLDIVFKYETESKLQQVFLSIIAPLSMINAVFYILESPEILLTVSLIISILCCFYLTIKHSKPKALKIVSLVLALIMILPLCFFSFMMLLFGNFAVNTVVETVYSPSGEYYAEVIDNDQGALGGNTIVKAYKDVEINLLLFKIKKKPTEIYVGEWGEFEYMKIYWKDDRHIVINSVEYERE